MDAGLDLTNKILSLAGYDSYAQTQCSVAWPAPLGMRIDSTSS